jgi:hypothetical protein
MNSYKKLCTEFYDIDKPNAPEDALEFMLHYAGQARGPILEPMCGSGRFLIPLLERGFDVDGTDASPHMLHACREHCTRLGLMPKLYEQYLHELDVPRQYGLVMIPAGSFSLITDPAQVRESLRRIYDRMLPGAKLVLEIERCMGRASHSWPWGGRWVERADGAKIIISWLGNYNAEERISRNIHCYEVIKDGELLETEFEEFNLRLYDPDEFRELLEAGGFKAIKMYKDYAFSAPDEADESLVFECSKE